MTAADLGPVAGLAAQLGYPVAADVLIARFGRMKADQDYGLFVAEEAGTVVGWVLVRREPDSLVVQRGADIGGLVVDEAHRGQGIGEALLRRAERWARENGLTSMRIGSNVVRTDAHRFYLREGYRIEKSWHLFTRALD